ncbi:MAG: 4Fe-4S binding protein [Rikenellaceae bacterium]|nr:4Fe-4S binding protein [Rikenellaceae bacterium]
MTKIKGAVVIQTEQCKGCGLCVEACVSNVLTMSVNVNSRGYTYCLALNPELCIGCASCAVVCPDSCITVYRQKEESRRDEE